MILELLIEDLLTKVDFGKFAIGSDVFEYFPLGIQNYTVLLRVQIVRHPKVSTIAG